MIQFRTLFLSVFGLFMMACAREEIIVSETSVQDTPIGMQAQKGRLRLKFKSRFAGKAEQAVYTRAGTGDIRIVSMKRLFPFAGKFEERTRKAGLHLWYEVEFDEQTPVTRALALLGDTTEIEIAEPVYIIRNTGGEGTVPVRSAGERNSDGTAPFNDPELSRQWHYSNTGELPNSVAGADINLFAAWQKNQGSREVIVAVIDGGIDYRHEDLTGNVGNPAELFGEPGVDDDGNGYIDDIYGWNFINGTNQIEADDHGTHVAGTIGAENNNGVGVCGIAGGHGGNTGVWLLSCQLFGTIDGREVSASFPEMIKYAADAGAVIAQNSWGYENITYLPRADQEAIDYFIQYAGVDERGEQTGPMKGGVVIFAAGNENKDYRTYPAAYEKVVSVAAYAPDYKKSWYSNFADWVDIAAPGGTYGYGRKYNGECPVYSTLPDNQYGYMQGTSMACPHVSGIAALIVSQFGGPGFTPEKLLAHLYQGTRDIDIYNPEYAGRLGIGAADAYLALAEDQGIAPQAVDTLYCGNTSGVVDVTWQISADEDDGKPFQYLVCWSEDPLGQLDPGRLPEGVASVRVTVPRAGQVGDTMACRLTAIRGETRYYVGIVAIDPWGHYSGTTTVSFVSPHNEPPMITSEYEEQALTLKYNQTGEIVFWISDPENQEFNYELEDENHLAAATQLNDRITVKIRNYGFQAGTYRLCLKVTDSGGAMASKEFTVVLEPNESPRLQSPFENVWFGSLQEVRTVPLAAHFTDEGPGGLSYAYEYDPAYLTLTSGQGEFRLKPLKFGLSQVKITATDAEGLAGETDFLVMTHDYRQEVTFYPNPVMDKLNVRMGREVEGTIYLTFSTLDGQLVKKVNAPIGPFAPAEVDLSGLKKGTYVVQLKYLQETYTRTLIKQ